MRSAHALIAFATLVAAACSGGLPTEPITAAGDHWRSIELDDEARAYLVHVPATVDLGRPAPLLIAFHGIPGNALFMRHMSGLDAAAAGEGLVVAYPEASRTGDWNTPCRDCSGAGVLGYDDVAFTNRIIEKMALDMRIDPGRVYVTGFSQGALMTFRVACELAHRVAAAATVAVTILEWQATRCAPARPMPIAVIHGTDDQEFPSDGRAEGLVRSLPIDETISHWVGVDACGTTPTTESLPDVEPDGTTVERHIYEACAESASVVFYRVAGGGHTWPGSRYQFSAIAGATSRDLVASQAIVEFLLGFSR
jgi:polyhydroxybutyrate depolymerase